MQPRDLNKGTDCSASGRAEVTLAIDNLADQVARLIRQLSRVSAIGITAASPASEKKPQRQINGAETIPGEATDIPLSPVSPNKSALTYDDDPVGDNTIQEKSEESDCQSENAFAAHVLNLRDQLGGLDPMFATRA